MMQPPFPKHTPPWHDAIPIPATHTTTHHLSPPLFPPTHTTPHLPPSLSPNTQVKSKAFILRTAVLGYGTTCVGDAHMCRGEDSAYTGWARQPARPEVMTQYIERMQLCMGLNPGKEVNLRTPSVLLVDREYEQGRAMVNAADAMRGLRRMLHARFLPGVAETRLVRFRVGWGVGWGLARLVRFRVGWGVVGCGVCT